MPTVRSFVVAGAAILVIGSALTLRPVRSFLGLLAEGDSKELTRRGINAPRSTGGTSSALVLAIDGVDRRLLYDMIERGELPQFARLLGPRGPGGFLHAHLDERILSPLPSSTMSAWASVFTGEPPGAHGVAGNEYFIREQRRMAAPAPVSFVDPSPVIETYTDHYSDKLLRVPTVYQRLRARDETFTSWVSMSQYHAGADRLLLANRSVIADAFEAFLSHAAKDSDVMPIFRQLDQEAVENVIEELEEHEPPRLLTVYVTGTDHYAHVASDGPDSARSKYLAQVVDPLVGKLLDALQSRGAMQDRTTIITADHGHTEVLEDRAHSIGVDEEGEPPSVLRNAGFRVRPARLTVDGEDSFSVVLAYGGALAYVYVADRSTCPEAEGPPCDWPRPPRPEDVVAAADALFRASRDVGQPMHGTLDLIVAPRNAARPGGDGIVAYVGDGRWEELGAHLRSAPRQRYVETEERLRELVNGPAGRNAGDLILVARNGNEEQVGRRYYFAGLYRSWHGSPSRRDSEVPFIVAHPQRSSAQLRGMVDAAVERGHTLAVTTTFLMKLFGADEND